MGDGKGKARNISLSVDVKRVLEKVHAESSTVTLEDLRILAKWPEQLNATDQIRIAAKLGLSSLERESKAVRSLVLKCRQTYSRKQEEDGLIYRARGGDEEAWHDILDRYDGLLNQMIKDCLEGRKVSCHDFEELAHVARIGLCEALNRYDPIKEVPLYTFARFYVKRHIVQQLESLNYMAAAVSDFQAEDYPVPDCGLDLIETNLLVNSLLARAELKPIEKVVILSSYGFTDGLPKKLIAIAREMGKSPQYICKIKKSGLRKIRAVAKSGIEGYVCKQF